jgi:ABC-type glycerol-3-phosphate transport system permease component
VTWLLKRGWMYLAMLAISAFALFPVYWVAVTSLKPRREIYTPTPDLWPSDPQWDQYPRVLGEGHVGRALVNSLIVAGATTILCLVVGAMAAYALTRFEIPLRRVLMLLVLMTQMFPLVVLVIPLFVLMREANLIGTYWGLVFSYLAFTVPLAMWVMHGFLQSIPHELEHAARIDGATRLGALVRVVLPLAGPGLAATAVLCFLEGWKEFMLALTFMNEEARKTLPLVLQSFVGRGDTDWGAIMATSVIYTLPVVLVFILLRKHLMTGRLAGAVKG